MKTTPVATGERLTSLEMFRDLFARRGCEICQLDITHCGGLTAARRIAALADAHRIALAPHNPQGPVSTAASLEFGFAQPSYIICETVHGDVPWRQDVVDEGFVAERIELEEAKRFRSRRGDLLERGAERRGEVSAVGAGQSEQPLAQRDATVVVDGEPGATRSEKIESMLRRYRAAQRDLLLREELKAFGAATDHRVEHIEPHVVGRHRHRSRKLDVFLAHRIADASLALDAEMSAPDTKTAKRLLGLR